MDDDNLEFTADDIEDDLLELIQEEGMSEVRMSALGRNIERAYENDDPRYLMSRVTRELDRMDDDKYVRALRFALAIDHNGAALSRRRTAMKETVESVNPLSDDTIRRWERRAMRVLARRLFADAAKWKKQGNLKHQYAIFAGTSEDEGRKIKAIEPLVLDHELEIAYLRRSVRNMLWVFELMIDRGILRFDEEDTGAKWVVDHNLRFAKIFLHHSVFLEDESEFALMDMMKDLYKKDRLVKKTSAESLEAAYLKEAARDQAAMMARFDEAERSAARLSTESERTSD
ncbi:hypothetical protein C5C39_06770 [Rathayibacter sp. AY1F3]|uniref:hypothetical protein n=1 Tax=Rathayibacter sp. AY1F3 TaxID=2080558 RepID=UPI000CE8F724|nr:hypothetical protein [Rathayibacter sp. AY1F3]PPG91529.1 hypothetical protein C5C39_06770 [Rathayibacter sp. AY1F3]